MDYRHEFVATEDKAAQIRRRRWVRTQVMDKPMATPDGDREMAAGSSTTSADEGRAGGREAPLYGVVAVAYVRAGASYCPLQDLRPSPVGPEQLPFTSWDETAEEEKEQKLRERRSADLAAGGTPTSTDERAMQLLPPEGDMLASERVVERSVRFTPSKPGKRVSGLPNCSGPSW